MDAMTTFTAILAFASLAQIVTSVMIWKATKTTANIAQVSFDAANRPLLGMSGILVLHHRSGSAMRLQVGIKNFGTLPAEQATVTWELQLNGVDLPSVGVPDSPHTIPPTAEKTFDGVIGLPNYTLITNGSSSLTMKTRATYQDNRGKRYVYCERHQYDHRHNTFAILGDCA